MSVHGAKPGDIYLDEAGKLWRCIIICDEPTVSFEEVEGRTPDPPNLYQGQINMAAQQFAPSQARVPIIKDRKSGGVSGLMWNGWKRIWRKE